MNDLGTV